MVATGSTTRAQVYAILRQTSFSPSGQRWRAFHLLALGAGLLAVALSSVDKLPAILDKAFTATIVIVAGIFLAEYITRIWVAPESARFAGLGDTNARLRWACSISGLIGLLAVVPAFTITTGSLSANSEASAVFCILCHAVIEDTWLFKPVGASLTWILIIRLGLAFGLGAVAWKKSRLHS